MCDYKPEVVAEINRLIELDAIQGPITTWTAVRTVLVREKIARAQTVGSQDLMCHPSNSGSLGVNAFTAHRTGSRIMSIGCDKSELEKSVCIELNPAAELREKQLTFNRELVTRAAGLLAPVEGSERYLSLGGGHAAAFFRAVRSGCKTNEPILHGSSGCLNAGDLVAKDSVFSECLTHGWSQVVLPWKVELV